MYFRRENMALSLNQKTHVKNPRFNKYRKKLTMIIPKDPAPLYQIEKPNATVRKLLKKSFFKKINNPQPSTPSFSLLYPSYPCQCQNSDFQQEF